MKRIRIYIAIMAVLLGGSIACTFYIWTVVQNLDVPTERVSTVTSAQQTISDSTPPNDAVVLPMETKTATTMTAQPTPEADVTISLAGLPESHRTLLEKFGYTTIIVTSAMRTCIRERIPDERYTDILKGSAPTTKEVFLLTPCFVK